MGGAKTKRENINTAPLQGLTNPLEQLLKGFLQNPGQMGGMGQSSALQQQTGNGWQQVLGDLGSMGGQGVIGAAEPVFGRNMQKGADTLRQSGPRFNSNTERLVADQGTQAMQDFNLFSQQAMMQGQQNQLGALQGAGNYANQAQGQNQAMQQFILGLVGQLGAGAPVITQTPGTFDRIMQTVGTLGPLAMAPFTGGASMAASGMGGRGGGGGGMGMAGMQQGGGVNPGQSWQPFGQNNPGQNPMSMGFRR